MSSRSDRLGTAYVHVGRQPACVYRDALRARGVATEEWDALRALGPLLARAELVEDRGPGPELWAVVDEHGLRVSARVIRWGTHVAVIGLSVRDADDVSLDGASWTAAALEQYARSRGAGISRAQAEAELRVMCHLAEPVDVASQPEKWRARGRLDGLDVSLAVNVVDREGAARLVVAAEARSHHRQCRRCQRRPRPRPTW